ncbi:ribonucleoside-triphosphate reductase, partial [Candidatus Saccharibacteria bacterium RIFCSPHIGHO2_12_FULL_42_8]
MTTKTVQQAKVKEIQKRDGTLVPFDLDKIVQAVNKAMVTTSEGSIREAEVIANKVADDVARIASKYKIFVPDVEGVQDTVEKELILCKYVKTAKAYILYREQRSKLRGEVKEVEIPKKIKDLADESKKYFKNPLGEFVYYRTYSRWIAEESRRETWIETVDRYMKFMKENLGKKLNSDEYEEIRQGILNHEAMPSMRLLQFAGPAAKKTNVCAYNCSYIAPERFQDLAEIMYISMCGTGVGWSVESQNVQKLPQINIQTGKKFKTYTIPDSKEGWADAFALGMKTWADGSDIEFDCSLLRPAGARLKTMGGKSSGPEPLMRLMEFTREKMLSRQGKRLRNIDVHDIICMIGDCVVSGGVRRSAMISLSDLDDNEIRDSKKGAFYNTEPQRMLANNSAVYNQKPTSAEFMDEWVALMKSGSGERGIFNRGSLAKTLPERRIKVLKQCKGYFDSTGQNLIGSIGTNPCGEIILQSKQFCNLSEAVARSGDTEKSLMKKVRLASILGTYQASLTYLPYLSKEWKQRCEKERLLGVSVTGQWDSKLARDPKLLARLKNEVNKI